MQTVVLNADYTYLNTVPWKRALKLIIKEKAEVLQETDHQVYNFERTFIFKIPLVLRLVDLVKTVYRNKIPFSRKNVFIRDGFRCQYCGGSPQVLSLDHVFPVSRGGKSNFLNCVTSCITCNVKKGDKTLEEAHMRLVKQPYEPSIAELLNYKMRNTGIYKFLKEFNIY